MDKQNKRVVGAAAVVAVIIAIAVLWMGWFIVDDGDAVAPVDVSAPAGPAAGTEGGQPPQPAENSGASSTTPDTTQPPTGTAPTGSQVATGAGAAQPAGQARPGAADEADTALGGGQAAAGSATTAPGATGAPGTASESATATGQPDGSVGGTTILTEDQVAALPAIRAPSFDVVRVNELGDAVIAGRAEPRSVVILYDGDREIGRVVADSRGEWVYVSDRPLSPGQHEIGLLAQSGPQSRLSDQVVVLIAPEPRQDIAGRPSEGDAEREKPLALLVPRDEIGATTVLQSPPAAVGGQGVEQPASGPGRADIASSSDAPPAGGADSGGATGTGAPVSIDVVDYDESGRLIVSGRSAPETDVRLYLDNEYVGTARTGVDGSFQVQPADPVEPGVYALRVDEVSEAGAVTARAETPFQRADEVAALPGFRRVVVQPGNSLWRLARRVYGQGIQYTVIYQANTGQIRNPDLIYPGQIFNVPETPQDVPAGDPS